MRLPNKLICDPVAAGRVTAISVGEAGEIGRPKPVPIGAREKQVALFLSELRGLWDEHSQNTAHETFRFGP